jgi:hypothetical protein
VNERLAGRDGLDLPPLGTGWLADLITVAREESEKIEGMLEEMEDQQRRRGSEW